MHSRNVIGLAGSLFITLMLLVPASASAYFAHVVAPGETLSSVAAADGLSVAALAAANGLSPNAQLVSGSVLQIPPQGGAAPTPGAVSAGQPAVSAAPSAGDGDGDGDSGTTATTTAGTPATAAGYVVQPGDTLTSIAARDGVSVSSLAALNGLDPNGVLVSGTALQLPAPGSVASAPSTVYVSTGAGTTAGSVAESQPVGTPALTGGNGPYPTQETVSGPQIATIASSTGVPAPLAQAIGWQESGWNNDAVSSSGAVGVMQIEPGTWDWIQRTLTAGTTLSPYSAADNVRGGTLLLHSLLAATGSESMAAAAYYQGLSSVQQHGMYSDTQRYVNDVMSLAARFGSGG